MPEEQAALAKAKADADHKGDVPPDTSEDPSKDQAALAKLKAEEEIRARVSAQVRSGDIPPDMKRHFTAMALLELEDSD
jgi:hypothetical protein